MREGSLIQFIAVYLIVLSGVLGVSLYQGTREFNYYCQQAQIGNPNRIYFSGFGDELGGFGNCILNTISADLITLYFGSIIALFVIQVVWLWLTTKRNILVQVQAFTICTVVAMAVLVLTSSIFPHVDHGFMEGGTWLGRDTISIPFIALAFLGLIICNLGPLIIGFLLWKYPIASFYSRSLLRLLTLFLMVISTQLVVFIVAVLLNWGVIIFSRFLYPPPQIYTRPTSTLPLKTFELPNQKYIIEQSSVLR